MPVLDIDHVGRSAAGDPAVDPRTADASNADPGNADPGNADPTAVDPVGTDPTPVDADRADQDGVGPRAAERISTGLSRLFRAGARMKAEMATARFDGIDMPGLIALHRLAEDGPQRAGSLADRLHMDPSQLSRLVAGLVREGLVERRADPLDGRATQLVVTARGREVGARFAVARAEQIHSVVADWDPAEADSFAHGLERFVDGVDRVVPSRGAGCEDPDHRDPRNSDSHHRDPDRGSPSHRTPRADAAAGTDHPHVQAGATT